MTVSPFHHEQRRYFHAQCVAMRCYCESSGLRPLVIMGSREVFSIYCDGNHSPVLHGKPVNDNRLIPRKYTT